MQQFVVPQFIDVEPKIIGPITLRQFMICLVGSGLIYLVYISSDTALFVFLTSIIAMVAGALAFLKINGMPMHFFLLNFIQTCKRSKVRIWNKRLTKSDIKTIVSSRAKIVVKDKVIIVSKPVLSRNSLRDLALIVDTGGVYKGDEL